MAWIFDRASPLSLTLALLLCVLPASARALEGATLPGYLELRVQLKAGNYEQLEATLRRYQRGFEAGRHSDEVVHYVFAAFATTDKSIEDALNAWVQARPDSYVASSARGYYRWRLGWAVRGYGWSKDTDPRRFEAMVGYFRPAARDLERAILLDRRLSVAYALLVNMHMAMGQRAGMTWARDRGLVPVPGSREIRLRYLYGTLPKWGGSIAEIEGFVGATLQDHPGDPHLASLEGYPDYAKADQLAHGGRRQDAVSYFDLALSYGQDLWIAFQRGSNHLSLGYLGAALADADRLLAETPDNARFLDLRANIYKRMKRRDLALADWNRAIALDPYDTYYLRNRAALYRQEKRFEKAAADLDDALMFGAYDDDVRARRGSLFLYDMKRADKAVTEYRLATTLAPDKAPHWYNLTAALYRTIDCDFIQTGRRYLDLCKGGATCKAKLTEWVEGAIAAEIRHKSCSG